MDEVVHVFSCEECALFSLEPSQVFMICNLGRNCNSVLSRIMHVHHIPLEILSNYYSQDAIIMGR